MAAAPATPGGPRRDTAEEVVDHLLAVQAENAGQAAWAVACRTRVPGSGDLEALLADGRVLRTHVLRPTWHFVAAADAGWLLELTGPRVRPVFLRQLQDHSLTGAVLATVATPMRPSPTGCRW